MPKCAFCKKNIGLSAKFITLDLPKEESAGKILTKIAVNVASTIFLGDDIWQESKQGFYICPECKRDHWDQGERITLAMKDGVEFTFNHFSSHPIPPEEPQTPQVQSLQNDNVNICPNCGKDNKLDATFCRKCLKKLPKVVYVMAPNVNQQPPPIRQMAPQGTYSPQPTSEEKGKACPYCGKTNKEDATFCRKCLKKFPHEGFHLTKQQIDQLSDEARQMEKAQQWETAAGIWEDIEQGAEELGWKDAQKQAQKKKLELYKKFTPNTEKKGISPPSSPMSNIETPAHNTGKFCPYCGKSNTSMAQFCQYCGKSFPS